MTGRNPCVETIHKWEVPIKVKSSLLIQGLVNEVDKDNQMAPLGDTRSGLLIQGDAKSRVS